MTPLLSPTLSRQQGVLTLPPQCLSRDHTFLFTLQPPTTPLIQVTAKKDLFGPLVCCHPKPMLFLVATGVFLKHFLKPV